MTDGPILSPRQRQAAQTRHTIVNTARHLFAQNGYANTSIAEIAKAAGVSVQTIYDSVGKKADLVRALNDLIDVESGIAPLFGRIPTAETGRELLEIATTIARNIGEHCDDIIAAVLSGASASPELDTVRVEGQRRHRDGIRHLCGRLAELDVLRDDSDFDETVDIVAGLTDVRLAWLLVDGYGWGWDRWQERTIDAVIRLVFREED